MRASTFFAVVLSAVFFAPACGVLFLCGCTTLWQGAEKLCSINIGPPPPCPWCDSLALGAMGFGFAVAPLLLPWFLGGKRAIPAWTPLALILPGYFVAALLTFLLTSYPHFLVKGLRGMLGLPGGPF